MNSKKMAVLSALALALVLGVMIFGGRKTRATVGGPICNVPADYLTIQGAVNDPGCTTINVGAGTYNELVQISRTVTLNGAQVGVDARTRAVPVSSESVVGSGDGAFQILADNVVIDGFTIQGVTNDPNVVGHGLVAGIWTNPGFSGTNGGHQIRNNIIQNNIIGIELDNTGLFQTKVQFNLIQNNNFSGPDGGTGIDTNFGLNNAVIDSNKIAGNINSGIDVNAPGSTLTYSNNEFDSNRRAMGLSSVASSTISMNNIHNSTDSATADIRIFGGVNGLTISCNDITNGAGRGIRMNDSCGGTCPNSNITINSNNIAGNAVAGLVVDHLGYAGVLNAQGDWWGSPTGPTIASNPGGTGDKIDDPDGIVDYNPFLTSPSPCAPVIDLCPTDPNKTAPGVCGCGIPDTDTDGDGTPDCHDQCPNDPNKTTPGSCGCGVPDIPGCATTPVTMGPQAMEGDLKVHPGDILKVGYDFTMPGSHAAATVSFLNSKVTFQYTCVSGPGAGSFAVMMPDRTYSDPQNSSAWYPSGDQKSSLVFQGSGPVPNVCSGGLVRLQKGGTFTTLLGSTDKTDKVNIRWHYSANGSAGGWSGTQSVVPK